MERAKKRRREDIIAVIAGAGGWGDIETFGNAKREWRATFLELLSSRSSGARTTGVGAR